MLGACNVLGLCAVLAALMLMASGTDTASTPQILPLLSSAFVFAVWVCTSCQLVSVVVVVACITPNATRDHMLVLLELH